MVSAMAFIPLSPGCEIQLSWARVLVPSMLSYYSPRGGNEEKDGVLPGYNYFEKIASTWSRAKVKTALDAYKYIEKKNSENKEVKPTVSSSKKKKEAPLPDWYSQYEKGLNADSNDKQVNEEIAEIAKNLFED